jgi:transcriptional regulator with XRE-family HTH domain
MMNLKVYLTTMNMTMRDFCRVLDIKPAYMSRIANGHIKPGRHLAKIISMATNGQVSFEKICKKTPEESRKEMFEDIKKELFDQIMKELTLQLNKEKLEAAP